MTDKQLLPCPFCGGKAELDSVYGIDPVTPHTGVTCGNCKISTLRGYGEKQDFYIEQWNTRADIRAPDVRPWCYDCGIAYESPHYKHKVIPDEQWKLIAPVDGEGLLCGDCIDKRQRGLLKGGKE